MKAKALNGFKDGNVIIEKHELFEIKEGAVTREGWWLCDVDSPFFKENFELIEDCKVR